MPATSEADQAAEQVARWGEDPVGFVHDVFGPGYETLHQEPLTIDPWQEKAMRALTTWEPRRHAFAASKNSLKTCTLSWIGWWLEATRFDCQGIATSISGDNLKANLWKELAVWYDLAPVLQRMFSLTAEAITHRERPTTWWLRARSWAKDADTSQQAKTLAGLHSKKVFALCDEAGDYPMGVVVAAEAIQAGEGVEGYVIIAGNTTQTGGPLYRAVVNQKALYKVTRISGDPDDPGRCTRVSKTWARSMIAEMGRDHPWVKINVLGEFPETQANKLLGPDQVDKAMARNPQLADIEQESIIVGIDTALQGGDPTSLCVRQGCVAFRPRLFRIADSMKLAEQLAALLLDLGQISKALKGKKADAIFVDLGGPSGHAVADRLKQLGFDVIGIDFGSDPVGDEKIAPIFGNRRAEMAWKCAQWVKSIGSLPDDEELRADLLEPIYWTPVVHKQTKYMIEPKDEIKERLGRSPDRGDSLWLTWGAPVVPKGVRESQKQNRSRNGEPDPYAVLGGRVT